MKPSRILSLFKRRNAELNKALADNAQLWADNARLDELWSSTTVELMAREREVAVLRAEIQSLRSDNADAAREVQALLNADLDPRIFGNGLL